MKWQRLGGVLVAMGVACSAQAAKPARKPKAGPAPDPVLALRYPEEKKKGKKGEEMPRVTRQQEDWVVESDRAKLLFSAKTASITAATLLGRTLPIRSVPDAMLIDGNGKVYRQADAIDGKLRIHTTRDDKYLHVDGVCTPRGPSGVAPVRMHLTYDIHKATGFTQVRVALEPNAGARIREFSMDHNLGPQSAGLLPVLQVASPQGGARTVESPRATGSVITAGPLPFALWTDGVIGFELNGLDFKNSTIAPVVQAPDSRHYLTVANDRGNSRTLDMVLIRTLPGKEVELQERVAFEYGFSFLPWRRFQPRYALPAPSFEAVAPAGSKPDPRAPAAQGVTAAIGWESLSGNSTYEQTAHWAALANRHGMEIIRSVGPRSFLPVFTQPIEPMWHRLNARSIWYSPEQVREDLHQDPWRSRDNPAYAPDGIRRADWPHTAGGPVELSLNSPRARDFLYDCIRGYAGLIPTGMVHLEDFAPGICSNPRHGCSAQGTASTLGQHLFVERVKEMLADHGGRARLSVGMERGFNNSTAMADFSAPGVTGLPSKADLATVFNPFLRGTPVIWNFDGPRTGPVTDLHSIELALARCGLVAFGKGATAEQQRWVRDYFAPLSIYDIEHSALIHPNDPEWKTRFTADLEQITPVVYERKNDLLLVAVKNAPYIEPQPLSINAEFYNWMEDKVILFDTLTRTLQRVEEKDGNLVVPRIRIDQGPQIIRVMRQPDDTEVIWHDPTAWRIVKSRMDDGLHCTMAGVPDSRARVYVYLPSGGRPGRVTGAEVAAFDKQSRLVTLSVPFNSQGLAEFRVR